MIWVGSGNNFLALDGREGAHSNNFGLGWFSKMDPCPTLNLPPALDTTGNQWLPRGSGSGKVTVGLTSIGRLIW